MATQAQTDANRRNAEKSTGPSSAAGKAASRMNALKSGIYAESEIIRGEDPAALAELTAQYIRDHQPQTAAEQALVDVLVSSEWQLRRYRRVEVQLWERHFRLIDKFAPGKRDIYLGEAYHDGDACFDRLRRNVSAVQKTVRETLKALAEFQAARAKAQSAQPVTEGIGFDPSTDPPPPPEPPAPAPDRVVPIDSVPETAPVNGQAPPSPPEFA